MSDVTVIGPNMVDVGAVDKELEKIWKTLAPPVGDESQATMQASVVNLVVVADTVSEADTSTELLARVMGKAPCRAIILDTELEAAAPGISAYVSVLCEKVGERQVCCENIRIVARGIDLAILPRTVESFYAPDLPILLWWQATFDRPDLARFAAAADRIVIDSQDFTRGDMYQVGELVGRSRKSRTAVSDLNWARLTPYRQLFAQFFDSAECREKLKTITSVVIEATEPAALLMMGWLISRLDRDPYVIKRHQIQIKIVNGDGLVFRSISMQCGESVFAVVRTGVDTVEARMSQEADPNTRVARVPLASVEKLLIDEIGRSGRDRGYDAAVRIGVGL